jgi:dolichyl-diphosphooligosaccharide--protein glycosyltransferase
MGRGDDAGDHPGNGVPVPVALGIALGLLVAIRLYPVGSVFRGGDVVLLGNDPWAFRHLVDRAVTGGVVPDVDAVSSSRAELLVWTLAFVSGLLGGAGRTGLVLAWYPVVTALISGLLVYVLARFLTDDVRVGIASVVVLAVTPLHASRTALGFADHHPFDYVWLLFGATALTWLVRPGGDARRRWAVGAALGLGVAAQAMAWRASPLTLVPTAGAIGVASLLIVRGDDPTRRLAPIVAGFGLAAAVAQLLHRTLSWQDPAVAGVPVVLFLWSAALVGAIGVVRRAGRSWPTLAGVQIAAGGLIAATALLVAPEFVDLALERLDRGVGFVRRHRQTGGAIGETAPLLSTFGPVAGPIILLGFGAFLGLPAAAWGLLRGCRRRDPAWLVPAVYVAWFLVLALLQRRWAVQLGLFLSVFAGVGFVSVTGWLSVTAPLGASRDDPAPDGAALEPPDRTRLALLGGMAAVGVGSGALFSKLILDRLSYDDAAHRASMWMRDHAAERGWTYPRDYVFSEWGRSRMYNYLVNGRSRSYRFALENYLAFVSSTDESMWYGALAGRAGFVVTRDVADAGPSTIQARLHDRYGSAGQVGDGVGHFRAMWESGDRSEKVFTVVPGARVTGEAVPGSTVALSTTVTLAGTGREVPYERRVEAGADGTVSVVLAHPGEYEVDDGRATLTVDSAAVRDGSGLTLEP